MLNPELDIVEIRLHLQLVSKRFSFLPDVAMMASTNDWECLAAVWRFRGGTMVLGKAKTWVMRVVIQPAPVSPRISSV
jgi:hypothetical protein